MPRPLDGFRAAADDGPHRLISELLGQAFPRFEEHDQVPVDELPAGQQIVSGDEAAQLRLVRALCARIRFIAAKPGYEGNLAWAAYDASPDFHHMGLLRGLLQRLLRRRLPFAEEDLAELVTLAREDPRLPMLTVLGQVQRHVEQRGLSPRLRSLLRETRARYSDWHGHRKIAVRLEELLGKPPPAPAAKIQSGEPWSDAARQKLDDAPAWQALVAHALDLGGRSRPPRVWLDEAGARLEAIGPGAFADELTRWLELLAQTPPDRLRQSYRLLEGPNGHVLKGLLWCCAAPPAVGTGLIEALGRAAAACFVKVPGLGPRSARVGNAAAQVLGVIAAAGGDDGAAARALRELQWSVDYPSAQAVIQRVLQGLPEASKPRPRHEEHGADEGLGAELERAALSLERGDAGAAMTALLAAWRKSRAPQIAGLIDRLSPQGKPIPRDDWERVAEQGSPLDLPRLLPALGSGSPAETLAQLEGLRRRFGEDPRLAMALARLVTRPPEPLLRRAGNRTWQLAFNLLVENADPRTLAILVEAGDEPADRLPWPASREWLQQRLEAAREALSRRYASGPPALPTSAAPLCERVAALVDQGASESSAEQLLAAIAREPGSDELRLVYADLLAQSGDPRGELIVLQLQPRPGATQRRRIRELLGAHAHAWLGDLQPALRKGGLRYERGFPAAGRLDLRTPEQAEQLAGHPGWSTFEALELRGYCPPGFLRPGAFPALRELTGLPLDVALPIVDSAEPWPLGRLEIDEPLTFTEGVGHHPGQVEALSRCRGLPELRHLGLAVWARHTADPDPDAARWLLEAPVLSRLESMTLVAGVDLQGRWLAAGMDTGLLRWEVGCGGGVRWTLTLEQSAGRWRLTTRFRPPSFALDAPLAELATILGRLPDRSLTALDVSLPRGVEPDAGGQRRLERQARRLGVTELALPGSGG